MTTSSVTGEAQRCFITSDGFMVCNFVIRRGREIRSKSGKWLRFRARFRLKKKKPPVEEVNSSKIAKS